MRKVYCIIILSLFVGSAYAQNVAVINGNAISNKEFIWFYKKNHSGNSNASYQQLEDYLNLYIDFKLKVLDAKELGMDRDTAYLREVANYEAALHAQKRRSKTNAEYPLIINEYKDAVLMFNISEMKLWKQAQNDEEQKKLEAEWIGELRTRYTVKIDKEEIRKLTKP